MSLVVIDFAFANVPVGAGALTCSGSGIRDRAGEGTCPYGIQSPRKTLRNESKLLNLELVLSAMIQWSDDSMIQFLLLSRLLQARFYSHRRETRDIPAPAESFD